MKRSILTGLLILALSGICHTTSFAAENQTITMKSEITEKLTSYVAISSDYEATISWGDGTTSTVTSGEEVEINHTYSGTGNYDIRITGTDIRGLRFTYAGITEINLSSVSTLEKLNISGNKISTLNLSGNTGLKELKCSNNLLTTLSVANINTLKVLDCRYNQLSSLVTANNIEELYVQGNKLNVLNSTDAFDLSKYSSLKILNCENNNIANIIVSENNLLRELYCSNNLIQNIDLSNNRLLEIINCDNNSLTALDVSNNNNLIKINCNNNNISELNVSLLTNLKELKCVENDGINVIVNTVNLLLVDNDATITGSSTTTIKIQVTGKGTIRINNNKINLYPDINSTVENIILNGNSQTINERYIDFSGYSGLNVLEIIFTSEETIVSNLDVNKPELLEEMIPLKHNGTNWVITIPEDPEWYNYNKSNAKWANVMLRDGAKYLSYDGRPLDIEEDIDYTTLIGREVPEENTGSMYVWIPRYTYQISGDSINIRYSNDIWDDTKDGYLVHPAFNYKNYLGGIAANNINYKGILNNEDKLKGLWVAKYQASDDIAAPKYYKTGSNLLNASIGDAFTASQISSTLAGKSHMIKNTEWGAVAYLATAIGGSIGESTTNNVYGIYNMNSGAEYVSHYIELIGGISNNSVRKNATSMIPYPMIKYNHVETNVANVSDIDVLRLTSVEDSANINYQNLLNVRGIGIKDEIGIGITGTITKNMPNGENAFFVRGIDGIYSYSATNGAMYSNTGFRNILLPGKYISGENRKYYTITAQSEGNGSISPFGKTSVLSGSSITYVIRPKAGSEIIDVKVDNISVYDKLDFYDNFATYTFSNVNSNHEIFAKFASNVGQYTLEIRNNPENGGSVIVNGYVRELGEGKYECNSRTTISLEAVANVEEGYRFKTEGGWNVIERSISIDPSAGNKLNFTMPDRNVILEANFEIAAEALLTVINGDTTTSGYENIGTPITVNATVKPGYEFDEWEYQGIDLSNQYKNSIISFNMPSSDVTIRAKFTYIYSTYTVSYDPNADGDTVENMPESQIKTEGIDLQLSNLTPLRTGYTFQGWKDTDTGIVYEAGANFSENKDTILCAQWVKTYTITYVVDGNIIETQTKIHDIDIQLRDQIPSVDAFQGWKDTDTGVVYEAGANFTENKDTILEMLPNEESVEKVMVYVETINSRAYGEENVGETITVNATTVDGYTFISWSVEGLKGFTSEQLESETLTFVVPENDVRLIANYGQDVYEITATSNPIEGGRISVEGEKTLGSNITLTTTVNEGYSFNEWEVVSGDIELSSTTDTTTTFNMPENDVEIIANFLVDKYTISYDANGGSGEPLAQEKIHGERLKLSSDIPTKENHSFMGWNIMKDGSGRNYAAGGNFEIDENTTLYAMWEEWYIDANGYSISYDGILARNESKSISGNYTVDVTNYGTMTFTTSENHVYANSTGFSLQADGTTILSKTMSDINNTFTVDVSKYSSVTFYFSANGDWTNSHTRYVQFGVGVSNIILKPGVPTIDTNVYGIHVSEDYNSWDSPKNRSASQSIDITDFNTVQFTASAATDYGCNEVKLEVKVGDTVLFSETNGSINGTFILDVSGYTGDITFNFSSIENPSDNAWCYVQYHVQVLEIRRGV